MSDRLWPTPTQDSATNRQDKYKQGGTPLTVAVQQDEPPPDTGATTNVDLLTGGFPCQGFSVAGKRRGKEDDRYLWPEMFEVIKAVRPRWVIGENVTGIINMALDTVLSDLEDQGYATQAFIIPACAQNAPHRRDRVWIVANSKSAGQLRKEQLENDCERKREDETTWENSTNDTFKESEIRCQDVAHPKSRQDNRRKGRDLAETERQGGCINPAVDVGRQDVPDPHCKHDDRCGHGTSQVCREQSGQTEIQGCREGEPESEFRRIFDGLPQRLDINQWENGEWEGVPRVAVGVKDRVNRLKALGNAIVPQIVTPIMQAIKALEV